MRLTTKLSFALMIGVSIALAAEGYVEVGREIEMYEADLRSGLALQTRSIAAAIGAAWTGFGYHGATHVLAAANDSVANGEVRWLVLNDRAAQYSDGTRPPLDRHEIEAIGDGRLVIKFLERADSTRSIVGYSPVRLFSNNIVGAIEVSRPVQRERHFIHQQLIRAGISVVVLACCAWLLAMILGSRLVGRPIEVLIGKARRAGGGDFSQPLGWQRRDELGKLAGEIDAMCTQLEAAEARAERETAARLQALNQVRHADRLAMVGRLAAGLAHEIGTPLNVVSERIRMAAAGEIDAADRDRNNGIILDQLQRITSIIRQLLDFSRQHEPEVVPTDLRGLLQRTVEMLEPMAGKKGASIALSAPEGAAIALVDPQQIQQVVVNLVMNGVHAMPNGGAVAVSLAGRSAIVPEGAAGSPSECWSIIVEDQGTGISEKDLPHIFEPFFTTKEIGEGTGLGLSVSYGIVHEHGGSITVTSTVGRGSRFEVLLPKGAQS